MNRGTNKRISRVWLFVLIVISIPVGGFFALGVKKFRPEEFWFEFSIGGVAMIIVLGVISRLVFGYYRRTKDEKAAYRGLFVYNFLLVWFAVIAIVLYPNVQKVQTQELYLKNLEAEVIQEFEAIVMKEKPLNSELKFEIQRSAESLCDVIKIDKDLLEKLMKDKLPYSQELIEKYPRLKENQNLVMEFTNSKILAELLTLE